jgi:hypothetical protein
MAKKAGAAARKTAPSTKKIPATSRVQVKNPVTDRWVKIDTTTGRIIDHKKSPGPYKNVKKKA